METEDKQAPENRQTRTKLAGLMRTRQQKIGLIVIACAVLLLSVLIFLKSDANKKDAVLCDLYHEQPDAQDEQCPVHTSSEPWLFTGAFGLAFAMLVAGLFVYFAQGSKQESIKPGSAPALVPVDVSKLNDEEKVVYSLLRKNQGSMYQSDLVKETGLTKVRVSRILDKMETQGILERKRRGMTNIVVLK